MQLMDRSSLGRDYNAFKNLYSRIERALQYIVNGMHPMLPTFWPCLMV